MFVDVKDGRLYYKEQGEGSALILLHDGLFDHNTWHWQFEPFAEERRVISYDRRNYGQSDRPAAPFSDIEDLLYLMDALDIEKASLVGGSNGGKVALDFALTYPEMVEKLVLVGPALSGINTSPEKNERLVHWFTPLFQGKDIEEALNRITADPFFPPAKQYEEGHTYFVNQLRTTLSKLQFVPPEYQIQINPPASQRLPEVQAQVLLIIGDRDDEDNQAVADKLASEIPAVQKITMTGTGHLPFLEKPKEFNQIVLDYLSKEA